MTVFVIFIRYIVRYIWSNIESYINHQPTFLSCLGDILQPFRDHFSLQCLPAERTPLCMPQRQLFQLANSRSFQEVSWFRLLLLRKPTISNFSLDQVVFLGLIVLKQLARRHLSFANNTCSIFLSFSGYRYILHYDATCSSTNNTRHWACYIYSYM